MSHGIGVNTPERGLEIVHDATQQEESARHAPQQPQPNICKHCGMDIRIRNPSGYCDHLYYPDNCDVCKRQAGAVNVVRNFASFGDYSAPLLRR